MKSARVSSASVATLLAFALASLFGAYPHHHPPADGSGSSRAAVGNPHPPKFGACLESLPTVESDSPCAVCSFHRVASHAQLASTPDLEIALPETGLATSHAVPRATAQPRLAEARGPPAA